jgi:NADP-dependent 3-hydroxy acid dehydrogenase YdfG
VESFAKAQAKIIILTGRSESTVSALPNKMEFEKKYPTTQFIGLPLDVALEESVNKLFSSLKDIVDKIGKLFGLFE